jgi:hypothetical protein
MRRFALVFFLAVLVGAFAVGAAPALAGPTDWAVNGEPLAPGEEVGVKFASTTPIELIAPDQGIDITCARWKAKGKLVGGVQGTGELVKPKLARCTEPGVSGSTVRVKIELESVTIQTDTDHPAGAEFTIEWGLLGQCFRKSHTEPIAGIVDSFGPDPAAGNAVDFPQPSLPATTLTIGGSPAELVGKGAFKLPKHATLSQVEL